MKLKTVLINSLLVVTLLFIHACANVRPEKKSFFWVAKGKKNLVYLLGSIHIGTKDMYPMRPAIEKAFQASDFVAYEINPNELSRQEKAKLLLKYVFYPSGKTLKDYVSKKTYHLVKKKLQDEKLPVRQFMKMRAWFLAINLLYHQARKSGLSEKYGVDFYFMGKSQEKRVLGLESFKYHFGFFNKIPHKVHEYNLKLTVEELDKSVDELRNMLTYWKTGDIPNLERLMFEPFEKNPILMPLYDKMVVERNIVMTKKIEKYLQGTRTYFVVAGAGHFVGKKGIIKELRRKGYSVERR